MGSRTVATMCRQFHKLREKTPRGGKVALTNGHVHTRKRACKGRAREAEGVGSRTIADDDDIATKGRLDLFFPMV